jgi:hypothetical protein
MSTDAQRQKAGKEKRERPPALKYAQEITEIARYAEDAGKIRAVPGSEWAVHYDTPAPERAKIIQELMDGTASAADAERCKPSAIIYDVNDIERIGVEKVCGSIYERASVVHQFKPDDLTEFARGWPSWLAVNFGGSYQFTWFILIKILSPKPAMPQGSNLSFGNGIGNNLNLAIFFKCSESISLFSDPFSNALLHNS